MTVLGNMKRQICFKNNNSLTASPRATYSASEVERVTHYLRVLENQHPLAPPHMITPPDTDRLPVAIEAWSASANTSNEILDKVLSEM